MFVLVDCNNFYASCERAFNPRLEKRPIVVLSNNDGCIIARSYEAKALGVPMGSPFFKWEKFCKENNIAVFSSNYELYGDMSKRVMDLLGKWFHKVEVYSIDEAFILVDVEVENITDYAARCRRHIKQCTGLPVSVGIGSTKTRAKTANYLAKNHTRSGVCYLNDSMLSVLKTFPVEKIWGIGNALAKRLQDFKILTAHDLKEADSKLMRKVFGVTMEKIIYELRGTACLAMETIQPRKQIISSRSFGKSLSSLTDLEEAISHYVVIACQKLRKQQHVACGVGVFLETNFFNKELPQQSDSAFFSFPIPTSDTTYVIRIAKKCIKKLYKKNYFYNKAGIMLLDLIPNTVNQLDLLTVSSNKKDKLMKSLDAINDRHGKNTIFFCAEGVEKSWQMKREKRSPRYTTSWHELLTVR